MKAQKRSETLRLAAPLRQSASARGAIAPARLALAIFSNKVSCLGRRKRSQVHIGMRLHFIQYFQRITGGARGAYIERVGAALRAHALLVFQPSHAVRAACPARLVKLRLANPQDALAAAVGAPLVGFQWVGVSDMHPRCPRTRQHSRTSIWMLSPSMLPRRRLRWSLMQLLSIVRMTQPGWPQRHYADGCAKALT
jgi:hypothetical protein